MKEILLVFSSHSHFPCKSIFSVKKFNDLKVFFFLFTNFPTKVNDPGQCVTWTNWKTWGQRLLKVGRSCYCCLNVLRTLNFWLPGCTFHPTVSQSHEILLKCTWPWAKESVSQLSTQKCSKVLSRFFFLTFFFFISFFFIVFFFISFFSINFK